MDIGVLGTSFDFPFSLAKEDGTTDTFTGSATARCHKRGAGASSFVTDGCSVLDSTGTVAGLYIARVNTSTGYDADSVYTCIVNGTRTSDSGTVSRPVGKVLLSEIVDLDAVVASDRQVAIVETSTGTHTATGFTATTSGVKVNGITQTVLANQYDNYWVISGGEYGLITSHTTGTAPTFTISSTTGALKNAPGSEEKLTIVGRS